MPFFLNVGYRHKLAQNIRPDGSLVLASAVARPSFIRRTLPYHLNRPLFDPQLYLAGLDANQSANHCVNLASYPWFGVTGIKEYDSKQQKQRDWLNDLKSKINKLWQQNPPNAAQDPDMVRQAVEECIEFQRLIKCRGIILPSPLTTNATTDYGEEIFWLDAGLQYVKENNIPGPIYATIALTDNCLQYSDPGSNKLLDLILDQVSAREVSGIYLVVEQGREANETRQMSTKRVLQSALHLTHLFKSNTSLMVGVNFFGAYGLALEAAGADFWASGWYKSLYRFRIADSLGGGAAHPSYWSYPAASDIHLNGDFDTLVQNGLLDYIMTKTASSQDLHQAARNGFEVSGVLPWEYRPNNIAAAQDHFLLAAIEAESEHSQYSGKARLDYVQNEWLGPAAQLVKLISRTLGTTSKTKLSHVQPWYDAFESFRRDHNI